MAKFTLHVYSLTIDKWGSDNDEVTEVKSNMHVTFYHQDQGSAEMR